MASRENHLSYRIIFLLLAALVLAASACGIQAKDKAAAADQKVKRMSFYPYPSMESIKIEWKKKSGVKFYKVYRVDLKRKKNKTPSMSRYTEAGEVSGRKSYWIDKDVKKNHYYGYVVRGYKESKSGEAVLAYDSYMDDDCDYACANLDKPEILNGGSGEFFSNDKKVLYLYVQRDSGVQPDGVVIYRKKARDSRYRKIKTKAAGKGKFDQGMTYKDVTVKPGTTYCYKARTYKKYKGKRVYSSYSKEVKLSAVNYNGIFDVKAVSETGNVKEFVIEITSREYNGALTLRSGTEDGITVYNTDAGNESFENQKVTLTGYSTDNKNWREMPSSGIKIKSGQTRYLKFVFDKGNGCFSGNSGKESSLYMESGAQYDSPSDLSSLEFVMDFVKGSAKVNLDFD